MESFIKNIDELLEEERFDFKFYEKATELEKYSKKLKPLNEILNFLKTKRNPQLNPEEEFEYIDIQSINVNDGNIDANLLIGKNAPSRARMVVHHGDIIISTCRPTRKAIAKIPTELNNQIASTGFCITRPKPEYNTDYILHILRSNDVAKQLDRFSSGTSYPAVLERHIGRVLIPVVSRPIQDSIAKHISDVYNNRKKELEKVKNLKNLIDKKILNQLNIKLKPITLKKSFKIPMDELLKAKRFDVLSNSNTFTIDDYPKVSWTQFDRLCLISTKNKTSSNNNSDKIQYCGIPNINTELAEIDIQNLESSEILGAKREAKGGDILFARIEPCIYNLKTAIVPNTINTLLCSTELFVARCNSGIDSYFILWFLRSDLTQMQIKGKMTGSTGRRRLEVEDFKNLWIPRPSKTKQKEIGTLYKKHLKQIKNISIKSEKIIRDAEDYMIKKIINNT